MIWKNEYNIYIITIALVTFVFGAAYNLTPFLYSKALLVHKTNDNLQAFINTNKRLEEKRFSFLLRTKKADKTFYCAYSKYTDYRICKKGGKQS
jgi:hypothetical protein